MGSIDTFPEVAARAGATAVAAIQRRPQSAGIARDRIGNTLHCNLDLAGSAAQFNPSVSARPTHAPATRYVRAAAGEFPLFSPISTF